MKRILIMILVFVFGVVLGIIFMKIYHDKNSSKTGIVQQEEISSTPTPVPTDTPTPTPTPTFTPTPTPDLSIELQSDNTTERLKEILVGESGPWYDYPHMAAGESANYTFNSDGTFVYKSSQYNGIERLKSFSGKWDIVKKNLLQLIITKKVWLVGGHLEKSLGSVGTEYEIVDGEFKETALDTPEEIFYTLSDLEIDKQYPNPLMISINGIPFWKYYSSGDESIEGLLEEDF